MPAPAPRPPAPRTAALPPALLAALLGLTLAGCAGEPSTPPPAPDADPAEPAVADAGVPAAGAPLTPEEGSRLKRLSVEATPEGSAARRRLLEVARGDDEAAAVGALKALRRAGESSPAAAGEVFPQVFPLVAAADRPLPVREEAARTTEKLIEEFDGELAELDGALDALFAAAEDSSGNLRLFSLAALMTVVDKRPAAIEPRIGELETLLRTLPADDPFARRALGMLGERGAPGPIN